MRRKEYHANGLKISVWLPEDVLAMVDEYLAKDLSITRNSLVCNALRDYLNNVLTKNEEMK